MAAKLLNNFSNSKPHDTHGFKEEVKIKYNFLKVIARKFPNGTAAMMILLAAETIPLNRVAYCTLLLDKQHALEEKGNDLSNGLKERTGQ